MSIQILKETLLWCFLINYGLLIFWVLTVILHWNGLYDTCAKWFGVPRAKVDGINFAGLIAYKIAIIVFALVPFLALTIATR
ncbi:MAG: hypothetical protein P4L46_13335 [Fimbriimonas sp.]|nr:hypothetical protein [Fimbriimonas sp.]